MSERARQVGATLDALRRHFDLSEKRLAELASITRPTMHNRLRGMYPPDTDELARLAQAFGVPEHILLLQKDDALRWVLDHPDAGPPGRLTGAIPGLLASSSEAA